MNENDNIYMVTILAKVWKTLQAVATSEDEARQIANESFTPALDGEEIEYHKDVLDIQCVG